MDIDLEIEGVFDRGVADAIRSGVRAVRREFVASGEWQVTVSPSETRGEWDVGVRDPTEWHLHSFTGAIEGLPAFVEQRLREYGQRSSRSADQTDGSVVPRNAHGRRRRALMDIRIEERIMGAVTVLDIAGKLTMDRGAQHLKDKINSLISQHRTHIVVNLENVPYIDSGGLGQLVASYGSVRKTGGALKLLNVGARNHDLLSITRLVTLFDSFDSEAEAIHSFQTIAPPPLAQ